MWRIFWTTLSSVNTKIQNTLISSQPSPRCREPVAEETVHSLAERFWMRRTDVAVHRVNDKLCDPTRICRGEDGLPRMAPFQRWIAVQILHQQIIQPASPAPTSNLKSSVIQRCSMITP